MRPLLKPIAAVLALSLVMPAYAASHTGKAAPSKSTGSCYSKKSNSISGNPAATSRMGCWLDRISFGGDAAILAERASPYTGSSTTYVQVHHFSLAFDAALASNVDAHLDMAFLPSNTSNLAGAIADGGLVTDAAFALDEAYFTWSDSAKSPLFVKVGKGFSSFGSYKEAYPLVKSINQSLVQANLTSAELGFASNFGFDAAMFVFEDTATNDWDKYGFRAGYKGAFQDVKYGVKLSYVNDYTAFSGYGADLTSSDTVTTDVDTNQSALDLDVNASIKNVDLGVSYFAAAGNLEDGANTKPRAWSFSGKYKMDAMGYKSNLHASVEKASDSGNVLGGALTSTVKRLANVGVGMKLAANTTVGFDVFKAKSFATSDNSQTQYMLNASVRF